MNILIADDEEYMVKIVKAYFEKEGFTTYTAKNGQEALNMVYNEQIDLAILDWMMPQVSGIEVCKEIKANSTVKVLMLTAKGEIDDELYALQAGADDYVRKPFDPRILLVRAKKMLHLDGQYTFGQIKVDLEAQKIYHAGRDLHVTNKEFQLMKYFVQHEGKVLTRKALLDHVWGFDYFGEERTVDTHIRRLREKIGDNWIKTHRGMGYSFENPDK
ncbi:response regulator transcription factor [Brevibacillus sp. HB1.2]|uniref:response regulator transcription factor n=1 Tax=Brevibacillus TaxID=55080 RepID=UPI00156B0223|nr:MULTISPECIES: response regulator transcription factor [unclassified Brevibacillus]NRS17121.1 response regulator transcription factor [Brevibacillus sp. HB1.4B]NTU21210.1 response regulator transcription factor [Brevibacillus sp. HB1.2]